MGKHINQVLREFALSVGGGFAVYAAMIAPLLLGASAAAIDFYSYGNQKARLQEIVDGAAIAAVREAAIGDWDTNIAQSIADSFVAANFGGPQNKNPTVYRATAEPDEDERTVKVTITQDHYPYFAASMFPSPQIIVTATATAAGRDNICVIALEAGRQEIIDLNSNAKLTAPDCAVYSNSGHIQGVRLRRNAIISAGLICSAGGMRGAAHNFDGPTQTSCPVVEDPLLARPEPPVGGCDYNNYAIKDVTRRLRPGVYCGGIEIEGNSNVQFDPGIYIIRNGQLIVEGNSRIYGRDVGFFFTGSYARFEFLGNAEIDLAGPETGPMAGMLFYQRRRNGHETFKVHTDNAHTMVGVVYLPNGVFSVESGIAISNQSAFTAIVAKRIKMDDSPNLVLNTAYHATPVPVPDGIAGGTGDVRLVD